MHYHRLLPIVFLLYFIPLHAQDEVVYKNPPKPISDMLLAEPTPQVSVDEKGLWMLFTESSSYPSVEELAKPELRLAGLRINPSNYAPSRQRFINDIYLKHIPTGKEFRINGLPRPLYASSVSWSPDNKKIAFTHTTSTRIDLYIIDVTTQKATRINKTPLNGLMAAPYQWFSDHSVLYRGTLKPASAAPPKPPMPKGPAIQENAGKASPRPTFQDLIKSPYDEELFAFYTTAQLIRNTGGVESRIGKPAIYSTLSLSPDKKYLLIQTVKKPFSYLVPARGFPSVVSIMDMNGRILKELAVLPSSETAPGGNDNVQLVPRAFDWRDDQPATITWCFPLDSGLVKNKVEYRDAVFALGTPFTGEPVELFRTKMRYMNTTWGDKNLALVTEGLRGRQLIQLNRFNPITLDLEKLIQRNSTDNYANPGVPVTERNQYGKYVIRTVDNGNKILLNNTRGSSPDGDLPFLATYDLTSKKSEILWRCPKGYFESVVKVLDAEKLVLLTLRERETEIGNYWIRNLKLKVADRQITHFKNPYPQLEGVTKQKIKYHRADGVVLTGDLYLPGGYDPAKDGKLPVLLWAYPAEYNSAADAAQVRGSEHRFTLLGWGSPVYYVTQGYAVLNNAEMPVVAAGMDKRPNDNFVEQLRMNAEAAIHTLDSMGVGDPNRVGVGGHSYGAFMTANLLAHTSLFKAGIARSGAYNRSLTPFGFQNEDRNYWQAPDLYYEMSPFSFADRIKTPLLLIHGDADNNTGTYPIQSERMFNAIKGLGGTARYISLPHESHSYAGRENILHILAEQLEWLDKYVKHAGKTEARKQNRAF